MNTEQLPTLKKPMALSDFMVWKIYELGVDRFLRVIINTIPADIRPTLPVPQFENDSQISKTTELFQTWIADHSPADFTKCLTRAQKKWAELGGEWNPKVFN